MKNILAAIFSVFSIFAFANISNAGNTPAGTADYVRENADRFDGKGVTVYVQSAHKMKNWKPDISSENSEQILAELNEYVPFTVITIDTNGGEYGTIVVLVKLKKAKNFAQKYKRREGTDKYGAPKNDQRIPLNGKFDKELGVIIMR